MPIFISMAGVYIHIPFCKNACHYCNFYFTTSLTHKNRLIDCLVQEIEMSMDFIHSDTLNTIYLGGGTPSLLEGHELEKIFKKLYGTFNINPKAEITLEANPEDINEVKLNEWKKLGINRLSIGVQSFFDDDLELMNRVHNSHQAIQSIELAKKMGFDNISVDLIFGLPNSNPEKWAYNLEKIISLDISHLSCYSLTVEEKTKLNKLIKNGIVFPIHEDQNIEQYEYMVKTLIDSGFEQYEISNFSKGNYYSRHNSNYWKNEEYLGLGPSAHSYNQKVRRWNIANNLQYIESIENGQLNFEEEVLTNHQLFNEYILTRLRTKWGISIKEIKEKFKQDITQDIDSLLMDGYIEPIDKDTFVLTQKGKLIADNIAMELMKD